MNYGGIDAYPQSPNTWHPWKKIFLWKPKKIDGRWHWMRTVHMRFRTVTFYPEHNFEYQYAVDVFDLMQKDGSEKV
jgi:hypothetical protein